MFSFPNHKTIHLTKRDQTAIFCSEMRTAAQRTVRLSVVAIMEKHELDQRAVANGTGLSLSVVNAIVNERTQPTTGTVNKLLSFLRKYEPHVSYEDLFA